MSSGSSSMSLSVCECGSGLGTRRGERTRWKDGLGEPDGASDGKEGADGARGEACEAGLVGREYESGPDGRTKDELGAASRGSPRLGRSSRGTGTPVAPFC